MRTTIFEVVSDGFKIAGGHIGYIVRPSYRGKGVATEMLRKLLATPKAQEIGKLLVTCDETNIASEKTILKNSVIFESVIELSADRPEKKRFWIDLANGCP